MLKENGIKKKILALKKKRNALILAHNYERPEIQDIADYTGDSLELSLIAAKSENPVIVFCGVRFMAETAAILCPHKTILLPVPESGCALADMATSDQIKAAKKKYPGALVVSYVNTSADVKAESHFCCTSANAVDVRKAIGPDRPVIFLPDKNLGAYVKTQTVGRTILWDGFCPVHEMLTAADVLNAKHKHPKAKVIAHPECRPDVLALADYIGGTAGMLKYVRTPGAGKFFNVATELGLIHRLRKENPNKSFYSASDYLICAAMKLITLEDVRRSLKKMQYVVKISSVIKKKAKKSIERMLNLQSRDLSRI
ncbi:MAG: quinolinate synthase NadA [Candidatus Omnitrophica bacterium]|nr:quinolinate synthase NadA [Candidatus Omnitrophota bacterium]MDD5670710.1 quinolinate synthase NadA [Candidatus Omnitrophota bacterium]